jgi:plastocyanin
VGVGGLIAVLAVRASRADDGPQIVVDNFSFLPSVLRVKVGTAVTWTNHDDIPHSVVCPAVNLHSHPIDTNESVSFTFTTAGRFTYVCGLHPFMHAQVVVTA